MDIQKSNSKVARSSICTWEGPVVRNIKNGQLYYVLGDVLYASGNTTRLMVAYARYPKNTSGMYVRDIPEFDEKFETVSASELEVRDFGPGE